jgi:hypothetical protein
LTKSVRIVPEEDLFGEEVQEEKKKEEEDQSEKIDGERVEDVLDWF